tara:strand:- start:283 stop:387 length:105 start_codon:yes stop_codon:yes gene_type:complete
MFDRKLEIYNDLSLYQAKKRPFREEPFKEWIFFT